jgi:hypothetical protein
MRKFSLHLGFAVLAISISAWGAESLTALRSPYGPTETMDRLVAIVEQKGMTVLARVDHSAVGKRTGRLLGIVGKLIQEALGRARQHGMARPGSGLPESVPAGSAPVIRRIALRNVRYDQNQLTIVEILLRTPTSRPT